MGQRPNLLELKARYGHISRPFGPVKASFEHSERIACFLVCTAGCGCTNCFQLGDALFDLLLLQVISGQISDECVR